MRLPEGLATPSVVVDADVVEDNVARMAALARGAGVALRPHAKTHKCPELARLQLGAGARGLTVATIGEAEAFADGGAGDLFIAYPLWLDADKARRLGALAERVALSVGVDSVEGVAGVAFATRRASVTIEVDCGHHRTGVAPAEVAPLARAALDAGLSVRGVFTFPGHGYGTDAWARAARDEERALAEAAQALAGLGVDAPVVSGGSTPTVAAWRGGVVNELRPGVYVFNDAQQVTLGTCAVAQVALCVAATVVSRSARAFVLDAGSKALGADRPAWMPGFGMVPEVAGVIGSLSEHHAVVPLAPGALPPPLGARLAVIPNHVCSTVNLADELVVARGGAVVARWRVAARGRNA